MTMVEMVRTLADEIEVEVAKLKKLREDEENRVMTEEEWDRLEAAEEAAMLDWWT